MTEVTNVPVNTFEGRFSGTLDVEEVDLKSMRYGGRYVLVVVADYDNFTVKPTKEGNNKQVVVFKPVDWALVRTEDMKARLIDLYHLQGLDPTLPGLDPELTIASPLVAENEVEVFAPGAGSEGPQVASAPGADPSRWTSPEVLQTYLDEE